MRLLKGWRRWLILWAILGVTLPLPWLCANVLAISPWWSLLGTLPVSFAWGAAWANHWYEQDRLARWRAGREALWQMLIEEQRAKYPDEDV